MLQQEIKSQTFPVSTGRTSFLIAKRYGFSYKAAKQRHTDRCNKKNEIIADMGERPKPFAVILSCICICIAIVFAYIEGQNIMITVVGATGMNNTAAVIVGATFAATGLVAGHLLSTAWKRDDFKGSYKATPHFYLGLAITFVYLAGQYYLASRAGIGVGDEAQETVTTMKWYILGTAILEVLLGIAFLGTAIKVCTHLWISIRIKSAIRRMQATSKICDEAWQRYCFENDGQCPEQENLAIAEARRFYNNGGFDFSADKN